MILTDHSVIINVNIDKGKQWFYDLANKPENYKFDGHHKLETVSGEIGDIDCIIETTEQFGPIWVTNRFKFVEVGTDYFRIKTVNENYPVICNFVFIHLDDNMFKLNISITLYRDTLLLNNHFAEMLIHKQIKKESLNIKKMLENKHK